MDNVQALLHRCYSYLDSAMVRELLQERLQGLAHQLDAISYNMCKVEHTTQAADTLCCLRKRFPQSTPYTPMHRHLKLLC